MSGVVENLDNLDNKALRELCMKYGLPNIPITDTSRKLLIKRLRTAMEGEQKPVEKAKSRRETIHVVKVDTEIEGEKATPVKAKTSSRKTIGTPNLPTETEIPTRVAVTQKRRSGRTTPISQLEPVVQSSTKRKATDVIREEEEDSIPIPVIIEKTTAESVRQTRAPSLSKSIVVTTSYAKDDVSEIIELDDTESEDEEEDEMEQPEPEIDRLKYKYVSSSRSYDTTKPFSSLDKAPTISYPIGSSQLTSRITLSKTPTETVFYESPSARHYTSGAYKSTMYGSEDRSYVHQPEVEDTKEQEVDSPYLSDFARRLSRLKADPIPHAISTPLKDERDVRYYASKPISGRRGIGQTGSVSESFYNLLIALDQKYHLKRNFIILLVIFAIAFIFIVFF